MSVAASAARVHMWRKHLPGGLARAAVHVLLTRSQGGMCYSCFSAGELRRLSFRVSITPFA